MLSYLESGMYIFGACVYVSNLKIMLLHHTNYPIFMILNILSSASYVLGLWFISQYLVFETYDFFSRSFSCATFYVVTMLMLISTLFIDIAIYRYSTF